MKVPTRLSNNGGSANTKALESLQELTDYIDVSQSGKLLVLQRLMNTMRLLDKTERIVVVSNYTQTLDVIEKMCGQC